MRGFTVRLWMFAVVFVLAAAGQARADVCVAIDDAHDTLAPADRAAALLAVTRQFELAGEHVTHDHCPAAYVLTHVRLGATILATMIGPNGRRDGTAIGLDDLPALYSQMVRSLLTGQPMGSMDVIDRTNVTTAQSLPPKRLSTDGFWYARLGYGSVFGDRVYGAPALGLGYRAEFDSVGVDFSFFNYSWHSSTSSGYDYYGGAYPSAPPSSFSGSLLKLEAMYFTDAHANTTPYVGAGVSWGGTRLTNGTTHADGDGLQGELTAGYEIGRATSVKVFVQADAILPFYESTAQTYTYRMSPAGYPVGATSTTSHRYTPSLVVSVGFGWQRGRR